MREAPANRPAPSASGTFAKTPLLHLLVYALEKKLDGTIEAAAPGGRAASIVFSGGAPAKVRADGAPELEAPELEGGAREQVARALKHVASMPPETTYAFYGGFDGLRGRGAAAAGGVDPLPMLWPILRDATPRQHVDAALARIGQSQLRLSRAPELGRLELDPVQQAAAEATRARPATAPELARASGLPDDAARRFVYLLLLTKQVDVLGPTPPVALQAASPRATPPPQAATPPPPAGPLSSAPPPPMKTPPPPPPDLAAEQAGRWAEIVERAERIDGTDYFAMLGVPREATQQEAQAAFLALAKQWHPDRLPKELAPVREACSRVFARMSEAYATLSDDGRRARYVRLVADGSGSPEMQEKVARIVEAAAKFQKAEVCFKRQDYAQAEALCSKALKGDPTQPDYHAMHAWLLSLKLEYQAPEKVAECVQALDAAIALGDRCERAFLWRGMLHKRLGKYVLAQKDFKRVVELNPHNIDAAREVRLYQMRGGADGSAPPAKAHESGKPGAAKPGSGKPAPPKAGILGKLFKK